MHRKLEIQVPLSGLWPDHQLAHELNAISKILDDNSSILDLILHDLGDTVRSGQGAPSLSAEQVLRAAKLKNWYQLSYAKWRDILQRWKLGRRDVNSGKELAEVSEQTRQAKPDVSPAVPAPKKL